MAFWQSLLRSLSPSVTVMTPHEEILGGVDVDSLLVQLNTATVADLWLSQPHLRTVVSFVARNIAQLGVHTFERVGETDRRRDRTSRVAVALAKVDGQMTTFELIYALVADLLLFDRAYWWVSDSAVVTGGWMLRRLPPAWVSPISSDLFTVDTYRVTLKNQVVDLPASKVLAFTGYSPRSATHGSPTIESLRATLSEQVEAARYRGQVWKRGGRVSAVLQRPKDAPQWSDAARETFREDWYAKYTGSGSKAGGTPILEDGMTLNRIDFSAQEQQFVEAAKLSLSTVAAAFHVNPTMIGVLDNANYSNVREFRKMLYGDTLGPTIAQLEQRINTFLLPMLGMTDDRFYVEFNIAEKLQGSFEEQAAALQTATGAPWLLRSEARARMNLPAIDGADQLVTPLNVLVGGQSSATDSGSQNRNAAPGVRLKAAAPEQYRETAQAVVRKFFARQERAIRGALGVKAAEPEWWDGERWDSELSDDVMRLATEVSTQVGRKTAESLGFTPDDYDVDRTLHFLRAVSDRFAGSINAATRIEIEAALQADDVPAALDSTFTTMQEQRSGTVAAGVMAFSGGFASVEAAQQVSPDGAATKTWMTGHNPRPSHAAMDGETVPVGERFSNGAMWPADDALGVDEVAGCNCSVAVNLQ